MIRRNRAVVARARPVFRALPFEVLEDRRLMSSSAFDNPVVAMDWQGHSVKAEAGEYILALKPSTRLLAGRGAGGQVTAVQRALDAREGTAGFKVEEYLGQAGQFLLDVPQTTNFEDVLATAQTLKGFDYVEPNFVFQLEATPNDPLYGYEYGLNNSGSTPLGASKADADIDAPEAWDITTGSADVVVGVVDSGVDYTHPDLAANMWRNPFETAGDGIDNDGNGYVDDVHGINAATNSGNPMDDNGHGTHVAGTIAAVGNNGEGVTGVAWNAKIMALKFLAADGSGSTADAIQCLNYAVSMRNRGVNIRLTNNSWGGGGFETAVRNAIAANSSAGILFVAAAGNGGSDGVGDNNDIYASYPSNYDVSNVVAVAATDRYDTLAGFSNYGAATVDLAAPGVDIASTAMGGGYVYMGGTSMATPHVSGVAALAFSYKPTATVAEVRSALLSGVDKVSTLTGKVASGGRLNALGTLRALGNSLSGVAYHDADGDGSRGGAEAALAGRTVWLDLDNDAVVDATEPTRVTDSTGAYRFGALVPGAYTVRQILPAGWSATTAVQNVTVVDGQNYAGRDFGSRVTPVVADTNDQLAEAFAMTVGAGATGVIGDGGLGGSDVDAFSLTVVAGQRVGFNVGLDAGSTLNSYLRVFNAAGMQLVANDNGYAEYTFGTAGTYFFAVSGSPNTAYDAVAGTGDVAGSTGAYTVNLTNVVVGSDADDQLGEATPLVLDAAALDSIATAKDVDFFAVTAAAGEKLAFDIDRPAGSTLDSYLRIFDATGRQLGNNDNGAAPGEASSIASYVQVTFPTAGTYFVGVSANPNRSYNPVTGGADVSGRSGTYVLTVSSVSTATTVAATTAPTTSVRRSAAPRDVFSDVTVSADSAVKAVLGGDVATLL